MGFKLRNNPITMKGSPVHLPGLGRVIKENLFTKGGNSAKRQAQGNFTKDELAAKRKAEVAGKQEQEFKDSIDTSKIKGSFKGVDVNQRLKDVNRPETQQLINKFKNPSTPPKSPTQTPPKKRKKIKTLDTKITPKGADENTKATAKTITKKETVSKPGKLRSQKNIRNRKLSNKEGSMTRREIRLMKTLDKASSAKAETNKTAKSIDASKSKSADTGAKQTSARRSRAKAKRLENRATRIQGRIDRKASRQAQRKKIKENR